MKKFILQLIFLTFIIVGCSSDSSGPNGSVVNPCGNISDFTVSQNNENIIFNLVGSGTPLFYEMSVSNTSFMQIGDLHTINNTNQAFTVADLGLTPGTTYVFSIRSACSDGTKSDWSASKSLVVGSFCYMPYNITMSDHNLVWDYTGATASQYQVEYGLHGFTLGTGTTATVNLPLYPYVAMQENQTYDFYVRANCNGALGWSSWTGPYNYLCPAHYNDCNLPDNVGYSIERNFFGQAVGASISWNANGEISFETTFVGTGQSPSTGIVNPAGASTISVALTQNANYYFYVRAVCANGWRTGWVGPLLINIGS